MRMIVAIMICISLVSCKKSPRKSAEDPEQTPGPAATNRPVSGPVVSSKDLEDIRLYVDTASAASGRMPAPQQVMAALIDSGSPVGEMVKKKLIVIHPARTRDDIWAYEATALEKGGWVASANGVDQMSAADLKKRLGR